MKKYQHLLPLVKPKSLIIKEMEELQEKGIPDGLRTGVKSFDDLVRLNWGSLVIVTGYAGMGKSEFIDWLCYRYSIKYGHKVWVYSPENTTKSHLPKLVSKFTGKAYNNLTPEERKRAENYICDNFRFFDMSHDMCIEDVIEESKRRIIEDGVKYLTFEPFNSFNTKMKGGNLFELSTICYILSKLRDLAVKHDVIVFLSAHPTKPNDFKMPNAYDIAHSADFKNRADYVLAIHRNHKDEVVEVGVDKVRDRNYGKCGKCKLAYDMESGNYFEYNEYRETQYIHEDFEFPELPEKKEALDVEVSFYDNPYDANSAKTINLKDFLMKKRFDVVDLVRQGETPEDRKNLKKEKMSSIPCVTVSGIFSHHDNEHCTKPSGLMAIDIDNGESNDKIMQDVPKILKELDFIAYVGKSITGDGYFAICKVENPMHIERHFYAMEEILADKGITIDNSCKDLCRLRLCSNDDNFYYNPNATTFYHERERSSIRRKSEGGYKQQQYEGKPSIIADEKRLEQELENLKKSGGMLKDDYDTWFSLGMSLMTLGEEKGRRLFHGFSSLSKKYDKYECDEQFDKIINSYEEGNNFSLNTVFYLIQEAKGKEYNNIINKKTV